MADELTPSEPLDEPEQAVRPTVSAATHPPTATQRRRNLETRTCPVPLSCVKHATPAIEKAGPAPLLSTADCFGPP
ncbi:hypothetical protein FAGKG844_480015 [Frankia sp. AgKG'84/4]